MAPPCLSDVCVSQTNILLAWRRLVLLVAAMPRCGSRLPCLRGTKSSRHDKNRRVSSTESRNNAKGQTPVSRLEGGAPTHAFTPSAHGRLACDDDRARKRSHRGPSRRRV